MNEEQRAPAPHLPLFRKTSCLQQLDSSVYKRSVSIPPNPKQTYAFSLTSQPRKRPSLPNWAIRAGPRAASAQGQAWQ